jgi:hypothetical protein
MSVCSTTSTASLRVAIPCPHCNKDFQVRSLFNHIRTKHPEDYLVSLSTTARKVKDFNLPLEVIFQWKDEQENDKNTKVYACLGSNTVFLTSEGCIRYWKKKSDDKKSHKKRMEQLKERLSDNSLTNYYQQAVKRKDPLLTRAIYSRCLYLQERINRLASMINKLKDDEAPTGSDWRARCYIAPSKISAFIRENITPVYSLIEKEEIDFDIAHKAYLSIEQLFDCIRYHTDFGIYVSPKTDTNEVGIILATNRDPPYYDINDPAFPQVHF